MFSLRFSPSIPPPIPHSSALFPSLSRCLSLSTIPSPISPVSSHSSGSAVYQRSRGEYGEGAGRDREQDSGSGSVGMGCGESGKNRIRVVSLHSVRGCYRMVCQSRAERESKATASRSFDPRPPRGPRRLKHTSRPGICLK